MLLLLLLLVTNHPDVVLYDGRRGNWRVTGDNNWHFVMLHVLHLRVSRAHVLLLSLLLVVVFILLVSIIMLLNLLLLLLASMRRLENLRVRNVMLVLMVHIRLLLLLKLLWCCWFMVLAVTMHVLLLLLSLRHWFNGLLVRCAGVNGTIGTSNKCMFVVHRMTGKQLSWSWSFLSLLIRMLLRMSS